MILTPNKIEELLQDGGSIQVTLTEKGAEKFNEAENWCSTVSYALIGTSNFNRIYEKGSKVTLRMDIAMDYLKTYGWNIWEYEVEVVK